MQLNINPRAVVPALAGFDLEEVLNAAERLGLAKMSDEQVRNACAEASRHNPETGFLMDTAASLACSLELKERKQARYIVAENWPHTFANGAKLVTRWVLDRTTCKLVFCQTDAGKGFRASRAWDIADLTDSLVNANDMLTNPQKHAVKMEQTMPAWAGN